MSSINFKVLLKIGIVTMIIGLCVLLVQAKLIDRSRKCVKNILKIIGGVCIFPIVPAIAIITLWGIVAISSVLYSLLLPNPPKPEITYGEFPFRLEYEINEERKVIEDTVICEYDGIKIGSSIGAEKYVKWKTRLASGDEEVILLKINENEEIYPIVGDAFYYIAKDERVNEPLELEIMYENSEKWILKTLEADELYETYGIKIISWEPSEPIVNTFK